METILIDINGISYEIEVDENEIIDVDNENDFKLAEYAYSMKMESVK